MALTTRLVDSNAKDKINALIVGGDLIDEEAEDFQFQYSKVEFPDSWHPLYVAFYESPSRESMFLSNYYMWLLRREKVDEDWNTLIDPVENLFVNPAEANILNYIDYVLSKYETASSNDEKLNILIKEYFIALWGNGIEAYNNYRRTCMPNKMQPAIESAAGPFVRSALWPSDHVDLNENVEQKDFTQPVFWDINDENCVY